ncbi:MAG: hypothetical protein AAF533_05165 [Acidobacteriota bacterium]
MSRLTSIPATIGLLVLALCAGHASRASAQDVLIMIEHGPGADELTINWTGGGAPWSVFRSLDPVMVLDMGNLVGMAPTADWTEIRPADPLVFYKVLSANETLADGNCADGIDNDGDTLTDCAAGADEGMDCGCGPEGLGEGNCMDGIDNDGDGMTDDDPDCGMETVADGNCADGMDNDGDTLIDCTDGADEGDDCACGPESTTDGNCGDGIDNDGDTVVDTDGECGNETAADGNCADGMDNDGDTLIDCTDMADEGADCDCGPESSTAGNCGDGIDNDGDTVVDADTECGSETVMDGTCGDGLDNDGDTLVDCMDMADEGMDCACGPESLGDGNCGDGIDNDGDGMTDNDLQCNSESVADGNCGDGLDNDGDTTVDCDAGNDEGADCACGMEACADGIDNDGDGMTDGDDPECMINIVAQGAYPDLVVDAIGNVHIVYWRAPVPMEARETGDLYYKMWDAGTDTWGPEMDTGLNTNIPERGDPEVVVDSLNRPHVHIAGGYAWLDGATWRFINPGAGRDTAMAIDSNDNVYIIRRFGSNGGHVGLRRRAAGANNFTAMPDPDIANGQPNNDAPGEGDHPYGHIVINPADDGLLVIYRDGPDDRRCQFRHSFTPAIDSSWTGRALNDRNREAPAVAAGIDGEIWAADHLGNVYIMAGDDDPATPAPNFEWDFDGVGMGIGPLTDRDTPAMSVDAGGNVYITAYGGDYNVYSGGPAGTWVGVQTLPNPGGEAIGFAEVWQANAPDVFSYVIWEVGDGSHKEHDHVAGVQDIYLARIAPDGSITPP